MGFEVGIVSPSVDLSTWGKRNGGVCVDVEFAYGGAMMKGRGDHGWRQNHLIVSMTKGSIGVSSPRYDVTRAGENECSVDSSMNRVYVWILLAELRLNKGVFFSRGFERTRIVTELSIKVIASRDDVVVGEGYNEMIVSKMESHGRGRVNMREELLAFQGDVLLGAVSPNVLSKVDEELIDANAFHKMNRYLFKFKNIINREKRKKKALNIQGPRDETEGG